MRRPARAAAIAALAIACAVPAGAAEPPHEEEQLMKTEDWAAFQADELRQRLSETGGVWLQFLDVPALRTGLYKLPAGGTDPQRPHAEDEVYYVLAGKAVLSVADDEVAVEPGSVVYVKAGVEHRFHSIEQDLEVLVFFSRAGGEGASFAAPR